LKRHDDECYQKAVIQLAQSEQEEAYLPKKTPKPSRDGPCNMLQQHNVNRLKKTPGKAR